MLTDGLAALTIFLHLAIAVILVQKYRRTKDVGFIWLGLAVVIWPLVSGVFAVAVQQPLLDRVAHHQAVDFTP